MRRLLFFVILTPIALFLFSSCDGSGNLVVDGSNSTVAQLVGPTWKLVALHDDSGDRRSLNEGETYTIRFEPGEALGGTADCNSYAASYNAEDGGHLDVNSIGSTRAYCGEESHDRAYIEGIRAAKEYEVSRDRLRIGFERYGVLIFERTEAEDKK